MENKQLAALFKKDEIIALKHTFNSLVSYEPNGQQFFCVNPIKQPGSNKLENIASYRNILIEFDNMSQKEQWKKVEKMQLPWTTCVFSGKKSLHFIVSIEDEFKDEPEYRFYAEILTSLLKSDDSCINANRLSRLAGSVREDTGNVQELIEVRRPILKQELVNWGSLLHGSKWNKIKEGIVKREQFKEGRVQLDTELKTILPKIYQDMVEHGVKHPECETRHDSLKKFLVWLANNWYDETMIEEFLNRAANAMGIGDRNDVEGLMRWKYGSSGEFKR